MNDNFEAIKNFWESIINDEEISIQHRLKASELCMKLKDNTENNNCVVFISGENEIED